MILKYKMEMETRTLSQNKVKQFLIRIDLEKTQPLDFLAVVNSLTQFYDRVEQQLVPNLKINLNSGEVKNEAIKHFLFIKEGGHTLKVDPVERAFILNTNSYLDRSNYLDDIQNLIRIVTSLTQGQCKALRIGMRFINVFECDKPSSYTKMFNKDEGRLLALMRGKSQICRALLVNEYQTENGLARVQFGFPNKFYPSLLHDNEVILDIDSFSNGLQEVKDWADILEALNHKAYDLFLQYMNQEYIQILK